MKQPRFVLRVSGGGVWAIRDTQKDELVCIVHRGLRPLERTQRMVDVMLDALNAAVAPKKQEELL